MSGTVQFHEPTREQIEQRAYEIYIKRGGEQGSDVADWIMAEAQLRAELNTSLAERVKHSQLADQKNAAN